MLALSAALQIKGLQPTVSEWDPPLGCPEKSAKPLSAVPWVLAFCGEYLSDQRFRHPYTTFKAGWR